MVCQGDVTLVTLATLTSIVLNGSSAGDAPSSLLPQGGGGDTSDMFPILFPIKTKVLCICGLGVCVTTVTTTNI